MPETELIVGLKVPDNVAITAFHTLERMGFKQLKKIYRHDYYKFYFVGDKRKFRKDISKVDVLINPNKHTFNFNLEKNKEVKKANVLVQSSNENSGLLKILRERLGFKNIKKMEKGVLWTIYFDENADATGVAADIAKSLLMNENYQKFKII